MPGRANTRKRLDYIESTYGTGHPRPQVMVLTTAIVLRFHYRTWPSDLWEQPERFDNRLGPEYQKLWDTIWMNRAGLSLRERRTSDRYIPWLAAKINEALKWGSKHAGATSRSAVRNELALISTQFSAVADWASQTGTNLGPLNIHDAVNASNAWHAELREQEGKVQKGDVGEVVMQFDRGWTMQKLGPGQLQAEGKAMGHCVGGMSYRRDVESEVIWILSLRDRKNQPHVTIEIKTSWPSRDLSPQGGGQTDPPTYMAARVLQTRGKGNAMPAPKYRSMVGDYLASLPGFEDLSRWGEAAMMVPGPVVRVALERDGRVEIPIRTWLAVLDQLFEQITARVVAPPSAMSWTNSTGDLYGLAESMMTGWYDRLWDSITAPQQRAVIGMAMRRWVLGADFGLDLGDYDLGAIAESRKFERADAEKAIAWVVERTDDLEGAWQGRLEGLTFDADDDVSDEAEQTQAELEEEFKVLLLEAIEEIQDDPSVYLDWIKAEAGSNA